MAFHCLSKALGILLSAFNKCFNGFIYPTYIRIIDKTVLLLLLFCIYLWLMSISICGTFCQLDANLTHTYYYLSLIGLEKKWLYHPLVLLGIVVIFFVQQVVMTIESNKRTMSHTQRRCQRSQIKIIIIRSLQKVIQQINHKITIHYIVLIICHSML